MRMEHITILFLTAVVFQTASILLLIFQLAVIKQMKVPRAPKLCCEDAAPGLFGSQTVLQGQKYPQKRRADHSWRQRLQLL